MDKKYKVYKYTNKINGMIYIGFTYLTLQQRSGKCGSNYKLCPLFWNAIKTFGWDNFDREILLDNLTKEEAEFWERYYINKYNSNNELYGYNIQNGGTHLFGSENNFSGKEHNDITKQKIIEANKRRIWSEESRKKVSESMSGAKHPNAVKVLCVETNIVYNTIREAANAVGGNESKICDVLKGRRHTNANYHWVYANS